MKFYQSKKFKMYALGIIVCLSIMLGYAMRPAVNLGIELFAGAFGSNKATYTAPPSEYETKVNELWKSEKHQAVCKANAAATVALQLARKYLEEGEKQSALSNYDLPISEAVEKTSNYGKR